MRIGRDGRPVPKRSESTQIAVRGHAIVKRVAPLPEGQEDGEVRARVQIASNTPVSRETYDYENWEWVEFDEVLDCSAESVVLDRANVIPFQRDHSQSTRASIGFVEDVAPGADGILEGDIVIPMEPGNAELAEVRAGLRSGRYRSVSIGYENIQYRDVTGTEGYPEDRRTLLVIKWRLYEVSLVAIPADPTAFFRSAFAAIREGVKTMPGFRARKGDKANSGTTPKGRGNASQGRGGASARSAEVADDGGDDDGEGDDDGDDDEVDVDEVDLDDVDVDGDEGDDEGDDEDDAEERATQAERLERQLRHVGQRMHMPTSFVRSHIKRGSSVRQMTNAYADTLSGRTARTADVGRARTPARPSTADNRRGLIVEAMTRSARGQRIEGEAASVTRNGSFGVIDLLRSVCEMRGIRMPHQYGDDIMESIRSLPGMALSDFNALASQVSGNLALSQMDNIPFVGADITKRVGMSNFLQMAGWAGATLSPLIELGKNGEIEAGELEVLDTLFKLLTLARRYPWTRQLMESNQAGFLDDMANKIVVAARVGHNKVFMDKLMSNPIMSDGTEFWHADRGNVMEGVALSLDTDNGIGTVAARFMRDNLQVPPKFVVVSPANLMKAEQTFKANESGTDRAQYNPWGGKITPKGLYGFPDNAALYLADPNIKGTLLNLEKEGQTAPITTVHDSDQYDALTTKVKYDRGAAYGDPSGGLLTFFGEAPNNWGDESTDFGL